MAADSKLFQQFLDEFEQTVESTATRLLSLSEEQIQEARGEDKWARKQILGHLIDSAANNHQRFVKAQFNNALVFPGYEQERWVDVQRYNDEDWSQLVQLWKLYNLHLAHLASFISPEILRDERTEHNLDVIAWQPVDKREPVTLEYFIRDYAGHMRHHLDQIFESV
ncbi:MAG TPA: DinB family protein [Pyrinomonadaceae bacterium]|nr:DinB family protein [Pyrinomonadaceae bacterium]